MNSKIAAALRHERMETARTSGILMRRIKELEKRVANLEARMTIEEAQVE